MLKKRCSRKINYLQGQVYISIDFINFINYRNIIYTAKQYTTGEQYNCMSHDNLQT